MLIALGFACVCNGIKSRSGGRFSKDPVTTGPDNLPGRLTGNFTGTGIAFLEAPVNFPDTYRVR